MVSQPQTFILVLPQAILGKNRFDRPLRNNEMEIDVHMWGGPGLTAYDCVEVKVQEE
jgi:hypothetical protein